MKVKNIVSRNMHPDTSPHEILRVNLMLSPEGIVHKRTVYNLLNLFSQVSSVTLFLYIFFTIAMIPVSKFNFVIRLAENDYQIGFKKAVNGRDLEHGRQEKIPVKFGW